MAFAKFTNQEGLLCMSLLGHHSLDALPTAQATLDAAGESQASIGYIIWDDGLSHTVSSSGGKVYFRVGTVTWATAGSTLKIGIQDVTSGLEDGSYDVYDELVQGTDSIASNTLVTATMSSGSKVIANDSLIAVIVELTTRNGADSITCTRTTGGGGIPYASVDSGSGPAKVVGMPLIAIEADDGTFGWFHQSTIPHQETFTSFNNGSAADEYAMIFKLPFKCTINRLIADIGEIDPGETGELILYSNPTSATPIAERVYSHDGDTFGTPGAAFARTWVPITEFTLEANTEYAVAYRPTSVANRSIRRITTIPSVNARKSTPFGTTLFGGTRADNAGAFTTSTTDWPSMGFQINKIDADRRRSML